MKSYFIIFAFMLLCFLSSLFADTIVLAADPWMPYNGEPESKTPGYCIDIAKAIFEKAGHKIIYQVTPYTRAIPNARDGKVTGVVGAAKGDVPDFIFPANEMGHSSNVFFVKKGNSWKYKGISSIKTIKIGVIQDYTYGDDPFDNYIKNAAEKHNPNVEITTGENALEKLINMVIAGRIDAIIEDGLVMQYTLKQLGKANEVSLSGNLSEASAIYIAFPPKNPKSKEYAKILSDGITQLRTSGELKKILARYGVSDWK